MKILRIGLTLPTTYFHRNQMKITMLPALQSS